MPTTVTKTIRASGGDYSSLTAWEAAQQGNLVTADEIRVAECYDDWAGGLEDYLIVDGSTTDSTRYLHVKVAAGHEHKGIIGAGFILKNVTGWKAVIHVITPYTRISDVECVQAAGGNCVTVPGGDSGAVGIVIKNVIASGDTAFSVQNNPTLIGCLAYNSGTGFSGSDWGWYTAYNCIATGCSTDGFSGSNGTILLKNCVSYNNTTRYSINNPAAGCTNNASSSTSDDAPGGSSVWNITSSNFVNAASNDFHLATGTNTLVGAGVNLYSTFTTDVDGDTWPSSGAWDIGFDYRVAGGGATLLPSLFTNTNTFYSPTISVGAVTLTPDLYSNTNTFYSATVSQGGATQDLTPSLFTNTNTFYSPTVSVGAVTLTPDLFSNTNTFYSPTVSTGSVTLTPDLFTSSNTFYAHTIALTGQTLSPALVTNTNDFYAPTVTVGAVTLTPGLFTNDSTFYPATVTGGEQVAATPAGGGKGSASAKPAKRQKLIVVEYIDDVEELVEQVQEIIKTEPRKKLAKKVKKPTVSLQESPQAAFDWIGYYQAQLDALRDQQRAESLKQQLARNAQIIQAILEKQANNAILAAQEAENAILREEEEFLLLLMAA